MTFSFYSPIEKTYHQQDNHGIWSYGSSQYLLGDPGASAEGGGIENRGCSSSISESSSKQSLFSSQQVQLRFLNPNDYDVVKTLCEEWFPVEYPAKWFEAITSDPTLFSLAAIVEGRIIGKLLSFSIKKYVLN